MTVPEPWHAVLLALAVFRLWRLLANDKLTEGLRAQVMYRVDEEGETEYREHLDYALTCPWCVSFWLSVALYATYTASETLALVVSTPLALSAVTGLLSKLDE